MVVPEISKINLNIISKIIYKRLNKHPVVSD